MQSTRSSKGRLERASGFLKPVCHSGATFNVLVRQTQNIIKKDFSFESPNGVQDCPTTRKKEAKSLYVMAGLTLKPVPIT